MYQSHMLFHWHNIIHKGVSLECKSFHLWDTIHLLFNTCVMFTYMSRVTSLLDTVHKGQDGVLSRDVFSCGPLLSVFYAHWNNSHFHSLFHFYLQQKANVSLFLLAGRKDLIWIMEKRFLPSISSGNATSVCMCMFKLYQ